MDVSISCSTFIIFYFFKVVQEYGLAEKCKIRDPLKVESVLKRLVTDGSTKLQVCK